MRLTSSSSSTIALKTPGKPWLISAVRWNSSMTRATGLFLLPRATEGAERGLDLLSPIRLWRLRGKRHLYAVGLETEGWPQIPKVLAQLLETSPESAAEAASDGGRQFLGHFAPR